MRTRIQALVALVLVIAGCELFFQTGFWAFIALAVTGCYLLGATVVDRQWVFAGTSAMGIAAFVTHAAFVRHRGLAKDVEATAGAVSAYFFRTFAVVVLFILVMGVIALAAKTLRKAETTGHKTVP